MVGQANIPLYPSSTSEYEQKAVNAEHLTQNLLNGMASYPADFLRDQSTAKLISNMLQSRRQGVWTNRDAGMTKYDSTIFNSGATIWGIGQYYDSSSNPQLLVHSGNILYSENLLTHTAVSLNTSMPTARLDATSSDNSCIRQFSAIAAGIVPQSFITHSNLATPLVVSTTPTATSSFLNGGSGAQWGATAAPLPVKTYINPAVCEPFLNRMAVTRFGYTNQATLFDIIITNAGTLNTCTQSGTLLATDGAVLQVPAICGRPTALRSVQLNNTSNSQALIVGCQNGVCLIQGTGATTFVLTVLTTQFGIPSTNAMLPVQNDAIFLASDGIRSYSSLVINANLLTSSLSYGLQDIIQTWDQANLQNAFVVPNRNTKDIQFWIPQLTSAGASSNGVCNLAMVFNYGSSQASVQSVPQLNFTPSLRQGISVPCGIEFQDPNNNNQWTMFTGGYNGIIYKHYSGNLADTASLPFFATFPLLAATDNVATGFSVEKISIVCEGGAQNFYASCGFLEMMASGTMLKQTNPQGSVSLQTLTNLTTILSQWILGQSSFPSNYTQCLEFEPVGEGRFLELMISGYTGTNVVDLIGADFLLSGGGTRR